MELVLNRLRDEDVKRLKTDNRYFQKVIKKNDSFFEDVIKWSKNYDKWPQFLEKEDLKQEILISFMKSITAYDSEKGTFSSFSYTCMKKHICALYTTVSRHRLTEFPKYRIEHDEIKLKSSLKVKSFENDVIEKVSFENAEKQLNEINRKILKLKSLKMSKNDMAKKLGMGIRTFNFIYKHSFLPAMEKAR